MERLFIALCGLLCVGCGSSVSDFEPIHIEEGSYTLQVYPAGELISDFIESDYSGGIVRVVNYDASLKEVFNSWVLALTFDRPDFDGDQISLEERGVGPKARYDLVFDRQKPYAVDTVARVRAADWNRIYPMLAEAWNIRLDTVVRMRKEGVLRVVDSSMFFSNTINRPVVGGWGGSSMFSQDTLYYDSVLALRVVNNFQSLSSIPLISKIPNDRMFHKVKLYMNPTWDELEEFNVALAPYGLAFVEEERMHYHYLLIYLD